MPVVKEEAVEKIVVKKSFTFRHKFLKAGFTINGQYIQFSNGEYVTNDPKIAKGLRETVDFGSLLFEI